MCLRPYEVNSCQLYFTNIIELLMHSSWIIAGVLPKIIMKKRLHAPEISKTRPPIENQGASPQKFALLPGTAWNDLEKNSFKFIKWKSSHFFWRKELCLLVPKVKIFVPAFGAFFLLSAVLELEKTSLSHWIDFKLSLGRRFRFFEKQPCFC